MKRWAVGGLCAERLETQVAADSSAFLMCESARNMERMPFWVANFKDIYTSFNYRFNLEKDKESRNAAFAWRRWAWMSFTDPFFCASVAVVRRST